MEATRAEPAWGVDSEYGRLLDVLLCPPDHFHWLPASAIARATLESGLVFSPDDARSQHAEMVSFSERGPRGAEVSGVETSDEPPEGLSGFEVR